MNTLGSQMSWRQKMLLLSAVVAGVGLGGLYLWKRYRKTVSHNDSDQLNASLNEKTEKKRNRKVKRTHDKSGSQSPKSPSSPTNSPSPSIDKDSIERIMAECDAPTASLLLLPPETKQRIFYALLMQGERFMSKGKLKIFNLIPNSFYPYQYEFAAAFN